MGIRGKRWVNLVLPPPPTRLTKGRGRGERWVNLVLPPPHYSAYELMKGVWEGRGHRCRVGRGGFEVVNPSDNQLLTFDATADQSHLESVCRGIVPVGVGTYH